MNYQIKKFGYISNVSRDAHVLPNISHSRMHVLKTLDETADPELFSPLYSKEDVDSILKETARRIQEKRDWCKDDTEREGMDNAIKAVNLMIEENNLDSLEIKDIHE